MTDPIYLTKILTELKDKVVFQSLPKSIVTPDAQ